MSSDFKKFILYSIISCFVLMMGAWPLSVFTDKRIDITPVFFVIPFVMIITIIFHSYLLQASKNDPKTFIGKYIASSGLKLMIYLTVIVFYIVWYQYNSKIFLTTFLISYIVFTFIEVVFILSHLKK
jgi:hypothetical protein